MDRDLFGLFDLALEPEENTISGVPRDDLDLLIRNGDLALIGGEENLKESLVRRLQTPLGHYGILVGTYDADENTVILRHGADYGSSLGRFLSEPLTNEWVRSILDAIAGTLGGDERIEVSDVTIDILDPARGMVRFGVKYSLRGSAETSELGIQLGAGSFSIE